MYGGGSSRQAESRLLLKTLLTLPMLLVTQVYQAQLFRRVPPFSSAPASSHFRGYGSSAPSVGAAKFNIACTAGKVWSTSKY